MNDELPELRASDADRDRVAEVLRDALAEGRLGMEEFDERLEAAYAARTYGELVPLTADLPAAGGRAEPVLPVAGRGDGTSWPERIVGSEGSSSAGIAVMSGFQRTGRWTIGRRFTAVAFWGGGEIDLREARFADREVVVNCIAIMGGVHIVVPPGVEVDVRGIGIMGGFDHSLTGEPGEPGAPRVIVTGLAFWGGVGVERKLTKAEKQRLKAERRERRAVEKDEKRRRKELG
ncbi:DUF1707 SHOCT-like domain-containing protein [Streptomyces purpurogeneiscleroticus]|uniref:DUF1707 SHOCT-like domain-containing protein n=1 Tax=Streptomyces purpurogeneiscleroticus TaxID=68259 RepID=UPI001CBE2DF3|nr:DUF1707 domain-containing protein [Streptomyces purpurogeneiscleroticus]MBZ4018221.1 hypothetical protein [Streptomyces purpurogeneiscleroticus]